VIKFKVENICPLEGIYYQKIRFSVKFSNFKKECRPKSINNERFWNGASCVDSLDYGKTCTNASSSNECKYLAQETICIGPSTLKCQCLPGKYFNKDTNKCEKQLEIGENCSQTDSCEHGYCFGSPSKCQCLTLQYFDLNSGLCRDNISISASLSSTTTTTTSIKTSSSTTTSKNNLVIS
jgi:hypothetical protein